MQFDGMSQIFSHVTSLVWKHQNVTVPTLSPDDPEEAASCLLAQVHSQSSSCLWIVDQTFFDGLLLVITGPVSSLWQVAWKEEISPAPEEIYLRRSC